MFSCYQKETLWPTSSYCSYVIKKYVLGLLNWSGEFDKLMWSLKNVHNAVRITVASNLLNRFFGKYDLFTPHFAIVSLYDNTKSFTPFFCKKYGCISSEFTLQVVLHQWFNEICLLISFWLFWLNLNAFENITWIFLKKTVAIINSKVPKRYGYLRRAIVRGGDYLFFTEDGKTSKFFYYLTLLLASSCDKGMLSRAGSVTVTGGRKGSDRAELQRRWHSEQRAVIVL